MPTLTSTESETQRQQHLEQLSAVVKNYSEQNRNFFIAYLSLLIYVQAIIFSTTDLKLLIPGEGLKLPFFDLNVPLVGFYAVIPIFVIALHFNFLQNLESHHYKLMCWKRAHCDGVVPRSSIYPFLFDYAILEGKSQLLYWTRWANNLLCYNFGPITLGLLLIRFSDYQDFSITTWHYLAFVFDSYLVWKLRLAMTDNEQPNPPTDTSPWWLRCWRFCTQGFHHKLRGMFGILMLLETMFTLLVIGIDSDNFFKYVHLPYNIPEWLLPRIAINAEDNVWDGNPNSKELGDEDVNEESFSKGYFNPPTMSLRFIRLPTQNLPQANFGRKAIHTDTERIDAQLQGAHFLGAKLTGANLRGANLEGADLRATDLQGAKLEGAHLQGADLMGADLKGAELDHAQLQGSNLQDADLSEADLEGAQLQGVILLRTGIDEKFIFGTLDTQKTAVFGLDGRQGQLFRQSIKKQPSTLEQGLYYAPKEIAQTVLPIVCDNKEDKAYTAKDNSFIFPVKKTYRYRLAATKAFRQSYVKQSIYYKIEQNTDYHDLLKDIDLKLCTLQECADLIKDFKEIDCITIIKSALYNN